MKPLICICLALLLTSCRETGTPTNHDVYIDPQITIVDITPMIWYADSEYTEFIRPESWRADTGEIIVRFSMDYTCTVLPDTAWALYNGDSLACQGDTCSGTEGLYFIGDYRRALIAGCN